ncbi:L-methionine/branched-chain amino acid transporter [Ferrimonas sp.]|uniref:L-methionine/branched-chain amino acid transporter n=1 Tax=Ferrimonas sp. TaxID=2080861 RepID=UPI003A919E2F
MTELKGTIGRWQGVGLITTSLLGTSVFILPELTVKMAGEGAMWAWMLLVAAILPLALIFAELGKRFPNAGGPSHFVQLAFGRRLGTSVGMLFLMAAPIGTPAAIMMTFEFIRPLVHLEGSTLLLAQLGMLAGLWLINVRGMQLSSSLQLGLTLAILAVVLGVSGGLSLPSGEMPQFTPGVWGAFALALWAYLGVEVVSHLSAEFKRPERDFVPAMVIATLLVAAIYLLCTALIQALPAGEGLAMVRLFNHVLGGGGELVVGVLGTAAGIATVNTYLAGMSRLGWSLAQEKQLPPLFARLNRHRVPALGLGVLLSVVAASLVLAHGFGWGFETLLESVNGVFVVIYLLSMLAAWRLLPGRFRLKAASGSVACLLFAWSLGSAMVYGALIFLCVWWWQGVRAKRLKPCLER